MPSHEFTQVDVFGGSLLKGNPLAVVHNADDLSTEQMQQFAKWTNLSETTFLLKPTNSDADYRVRIFTPSEEFKFAGHPTLGSAHAWLENGGRPRAEGVVVQECGIGNVEIRSGGEGLAFAAPEMIRFEPLSSMEVTTVLASLGVTEEDVVATHWIDNGPNFAGVLLKDAQAVLGLDPDFTAMDGMCITVLGAYSPNSKEKAQGIDVEVRAFVPEVGIFEDPVTGSANAALAQWLIAAGHLPDNYVSRQGSVIGYDGKILINRDGDTVWVGGKCVTIVSGNVAL